jgi:two-component system, NtrC family, response regulator
MDMHRPDSAGTQPLLLIVDDDPDIREQMCWGLMAEYQIVEAENRQTALSLQRSQRPTLITLDLGLPPSQDGISEGTLALDELLKEDPLVKVIVITGNSVRAAAIQAVTRGAYDYVEKPIRLDVLKVILQRASYLACLEREDRQIQAAHLVGMDLIGESPAMEKVFDAIRRVAASDVPVLITGPSGTGKELVARAIHKKSQQAGGQFIAINCGAIPETLLESELFGYEKGAFTGAHQMRKGQIESAHGGTLFLDEIGDIPLALQVKLLRFLQDHRIQRLGGKESFPVDARIIAATNVHLREAITQGRFREDLFYRLCVVSIAVPPLSERASDVSLLAKTFLSRYANEYKKLLKGFTPQALEALTSHDWPGHVRELENRIRRAVVMAEGKYITPTDLELATPEASGMGSSLRDSRNDREKDLVRLAMERHDGNISKAASELGISRPTLYQLLKRYGLRRA